MVLPRLDGAAEFSSKVLEDLGKEVWDRILVFVRSCKAILPVNTVV